MSTLIHGYVWPAEHYSPHEEDVVIFYGGPFSNFVGGPFTIAYPQPWGEPKGVIEAEYRTIEHFFQACKATTLAAHESVRLHTDTWKAKRMGNRVRLREDWEKLVPFDGKAAPTSVTGYEYMIPGEHAAKHRVEGEPLPAHVPLKYNVMVAGLRVKFAQPDFREILMATGDRYIAEDSPTDGIWGIRDPKTGKLTGKNLLGVALMQVRWEINHA